MIAAALEEAVAPLGLSTEERSGDGAAIRPGLTVLEQTDDEA
jgi:hypothetical protein